MTLKAQCLHLHAIFAAISGAIFFLLMDVNEWISYECLDEGTCTPNIRNSSVYPFTCVKSVNGPLYFRIYFQNLYSMEIVWILVRK